VQDDRYVLQKVSPRCLGWGEVSSFVVLYAIVFGTLLQRMASLGRYHGIVASNDAQYGQVGREWPVRIEGGGLGGGQESPDADYDYERVSTKTDAGPNLWDVHFILGIDGSAGNFGCSPGFSVWVLALSRSLSG
jgi:hypothetical protein